MTLTALNSGQRKPTKYVQVSPVLLAALRISGVAVEELIESVAGSLGGISVGADTRCGAKLLSALPSGTTISRYGRSFDIALPRVGVHWTHPYCEADQLPFMVFPGVFLPEALLLALPGRQLSCLATPQFPALLDVDPTILAVRNIDTRSGPALDITLDMDWLAIPAS